MCATDDSYQKARQSLAQAEEETRSRGPGLRFRKQDGSLSNSEETFVIGVPRDRCQLVLEA